MSGRQGLGQLPKATERGPRAQPRLIPSPWVSAKAQAGFIKQTTRPPIGQARPEGPPPPDRGVARLPPVLDSQSAALQAGPRAPRGTAPGAPRPPAGGQRTVWGSLAWGQDRRWHVLHFGDVCVWGGWQSGPLAAPGPNHCPRGSSRSPQQYLAPGPRPGWEPQATSGCGRVPSRARQLCRQGPGSMGRDQGHGCPRDADSAARQTSPPPRAVGSEA